MLRKFRIKYLYFIACLFFMMTKPVHAYIDPSVMTYAIQAIAGIAVALGTVAGVAWRKIRKKFFNIEGEGYKELETDDVHFVNPRTEKSYSPKFIAKVEESVNTNVEEDISRKSRWKEILSLCILLCFTLFFYGPLSIYLPNAGEFEFPLSLIFLLVGGFSLLVFVVVMLLGFALPKKLYTFCKLLLFGVSCAIYVQGNLLKNNYGTGVLDGTSIDWGAYKGYGIMNSLIWIAIIAVPFVIYFVTKKNKKIISPLIIYISLFVTIIQIPPFVMQTNDAIKAMKSKGEEITITTEGIYDLGSNHNIIIYVLDTADGKYFEEYINSHNEFKDNLGGFVQYNNALSAGGRTILSMPLFMSGEPFENEQIYSGYIDEICTNRNAFSVLNNHGYDVRSFSEPLFYSASASNYISNIKQQAQEISEKILTKKLYKVTLFKYMPHFAKKRFWFDTAEFTEAYVGYNIYNNVKDFDFYDNYYESKFKTDTNYTNTMRLYHLRGLHSPYDMDANGKRSEKRTSIEEVMEGQMHNINDMLVDLKGNNLYENATIIITADHGNEDKAQHPLLLIK